MSDDNPVQEAKTSVEIIAEVIKVAGDDPQVKEAAKNLGETAVTVTRTINTLLMPLAAINFAFDKAKDYFSGKFQHDLMKKTNKIPEENVINPKASIAGPALQGLAFTHEEPNLKEMYLNLLATAMDGRISTKAHPAFVEIIKQLDGEEARLVALALKTANSIPIIEIQLQQKEGGYQTLAHHILNLTDEISHEMTENPLLPAMVDNWIRLGLVEVQYGTYLILPDAYVWAEQRPEYKRLSEEVEQPENSKLHCERGIMRRTEFGKQFAIAVGLLNEE